MSLALAGAFAACGGDEVEGTADTGDNCNCMAGGYAPVCGVDGQTYDAICGMSCVPVEIECTGSECPCPEPTTTGVGDSGSGGGSGSGGTGDSGDTTGADSGSGGASDGPDTTSGTTGGDTTTGGAAGFECGDDLECTADMPVCTQVIGGPADGGPGDFSCGPIPPLCPGAMPTCECIGTVGCDCTEPEPGFFMVVCAAP